MAASILFTAVQPGTSHALNRKDVSYLASRAGMGIKNKAKSAKKSVTNAKDSASAAIKRGKNSVKTSIKSRLPHSTHVFNPDKKPNKLQKKRR